MKSFRSLKIQSKFQARRRHYVVVPKIRLEGKWLRELGFTEGDSVRIEQRKHMLIITPYREPLQSS